MKVFKSLLDCSQKKFSLEMKPPTLSHIKWLNNIMVESMDSGSMFWIEEMMVAC